MINNRLKTQLKEGGKFVVFEYCISVIFISIKFESEAKFIAAGEATWLKGLPYSLISFLFGWWGFPFGPIYTVLSIILNFSGGTDVTIKVSKEIFGVEDPTQEWDCPECGAMNPNTSFSCLKCGYSLV